MTYYLCASRTETFAIWNSMLDYAVAIRTDPPMLLPCQSLVRAASQSFTAQSQRTCARARRTCPHRDIGIPSSSPIFTMYFTSRVAKIHDDASRRRANGEELCEHCDLVGDCGEEVSATLSISPNRACEALLPLPAINALSEVAPPIFEVRGDRADTRCKGRRYHVSPSVLW